MKNYFFKFCIIGKVFDKNITYGYHKKNVMRFLKYFLFFIAFALIFSVFKILVFENEVNSLFILETFVASIITTIVIYFFNNYSEN